MVTTRGGVALLVGPEGRLVDRTILLIALSVSQGSDAPAPETADRTGRFGDSRTKDGDRAVR
jgi:hypothetical protein